MLLEEYKKSLKMPEAEEFLDLLFYRPLAFGFVKAVYKLPVTPNQITYLSLLCGLGAAYELSIGSWTALVWAAFWYAMANVLDCADGQLARLQKSGTAYGRLVDGVADYISSIAIFIGIGLGLQHAGEPNWFLLIAAGVSSAIHAMIFDHYQGEYISAVRGEGGFTETERDRISSELIGSSQSRGAFKSFVLSSYLHYLSTQRRASTKSFRDNIDPQVYRKFNSVVIRLWSLLGPTTNRTLLIVCALFNRVDLYLWIVCSFGNAWLLIVYLLQKRIHLKLSAMANGAT